MALAWLAWFHKKTSANDKHPMDAENGRLSMEMIHGAFESHFQGGRRIAIPPEQRDHPLARRAAQP